MLKNDRMESFLRCNFYQVGNSGKITVLFVILCELQTEHTEGVRKLNYVVSLVDAILEVVSARGTPFTVLAESVAIRQVCTAMVYHWSKTRRPIFFSRFPYAQTAGF